MAQLQMISRKNGTYLGNVFFCSHPEDQEQYLDPIAQELIRKQNCSVWYLPTNVERDAQFYEDLKEMQLFVIPVTKRLLTTKNVGLEDFRFAVAHNIPVLPLLQEPGLEPLFNSVCGNLHCLSKVSDDPNAIDYDTKLTQFLKSTLIGDEMVAKIQKAFDAYVFLSYRKKDRHHAQELMRLIHKDPKYRDIAIWYDEFLVPGEDFNDSIRDNILKSKLFLMAVTPNLVNEENYVMNQEYPLAQKLEKRILPAEMAETNKDALCRHFNGIPLTIDPRNPQQLSDAMVEALGEIAIQENNEAPDHLFFMGLAYLYGIDVEVDKDRGADLIRSAANANYEPAMEKLIEMYRNGQGVPRDAREVFRWKWKQAQLILKRDIIDKLLEVTKIELDHTYSKMAFPSSNGSHYVEYETNHVIKLRKNTISMCALNWLQSLTEAAQILRDAGGVPTKILDELKPSIRFLEEYANLDTYLLQNQSGLNDFSMERRVLDFYIMQVELLLEAHDYSGAEALLNKMDANFREANAGTWQGCIYEGHIFQLRMELLLDQGDYEKAELCREAWEQYLPTAIRRFNTAAAQERATYDPLEAVLMLLMQTQALDFAGKQTGELCIAYGKAAARLYSAVGKSAEAESAYDEILGGLRIAKKTDPALEAWTYLKMAGLCTEKAAAYLDEAERRMVDLPQTDLRYMPLYRDYSMVQGDMAEDGTAHYEKAFTVALELAYDVPSPENMAAAGIICRKLAAFVPAEQADSYARQLQEMMNAHAAILRKKHCAEVLAGLYEVIASITGGDALEKAISIYADLIEKYPQCLRYQAKLDSL